MKCTCGREMQRKKTKDRRFIYVCPVCHKVIKGSKDETQTDEYEKAFNIMMGQTDPSR